MTTVLDALVARLTEAGAHNQGAEVPPAIVLWSDGERRWLPALAALRERVPSLWTLGAFSPEDEQGPAPWVKWRLGSLGAADPIPVLYLPGVQRLAFRSLEDFPDELKPIAELQFRGAWWTQANGKDWTPFAFLSSKNGGLGLTVAEDSATTDALGRLVTRVLRAPVASLQKARVEAEHLFALLTEDLEGDLLDWLNDPEAARTSYRDDEWGVFAGYAKKRFSVDLDADGPIVVGERLVQKEGPWTKVWNRYVDGVPHRYPTVHRVLEKVHPSSLVFDKSTLPAHNAQQEEALRAELIALGDRSETEARAQVEVLDAEHGPRRGWVWSKLGQSRMAEVLGHLAELASASNEPIAGTTRAALADWYGKAGYRADAAALAALALADHADGPAIHAAVRSLYLPWLQRLAERLREIVDVEGYPDSHPVAAEVGTCLLFADGLRWDVGQQLAARLSRNGAIVESEGRWVTFPPVTGTSKPDVSHIRDKLSGGEGAGDFTPSVAETGKTLTSARFNKLMEQAGVQLLSGNETGDPSGRAWTEFGDIDKYGHKHGCKTARHIDDQLRELEQRVAELLAAGWQRIRIATDHGWVLVPGGMPKADVPAGLSETRWGRCALLKATSKVELPSLPWGWDKGVEVTYAPGVCAFYANMEYAHGGLTMQECFTPVLTVSKDAPEIAATIDELKWVGLRCRTRVTTTASGLRLDVRLKVADPTTSVLAEPRAVAADGTCSVLVPDDTLEGSAAFAVLLSPDGTVLEKRTTTIGGDQ